MKIEKINYPDGSFYPKIVFPKHNVDYPENLTFRINSYNDLWYLRQIKDICDHNKRKVNLTLPNLFDAQADRRFNEDESANLKLICEFINNMKWNSVTIFHPHNAEVVEALIEDVKIIDNHEFIGGVLNSFRTMGERINSSDPWFGLENLTLMSTDAGGFKPLMKLADKLNWTNDVYSASKSRMYEDGKSKLIQQIDKMDFGGKDILIVDDISVYGGTFIGLAEMLKERNCGKLYLAVSHITVEKPNPKLFQLFEKVFTTNSKDLDYDKYLNLEIVNLFG